MNLEMIKSKAERREAFRKARAHKYIKRTGIPGKYVYWYKGESGKLVSGKDKSETKNKKDNLFSEAKKYNNSEDFINSREKIYHGGLLTDIEDIKETFEDVHVAEYDDPVAMIGVNFSDKSTAEYFQKRRGGKMIELNFVPQKTKVFGSYSKVLNKMIEYSESERLIRQTKEIRDINEKNEFLIDNKFDSSWAGKFKEALLDKGFDSVSFKNEMDGGTTIIPLSVNVLKSDDQLKKIWALANNKGG